LTLGLRVIRSDGFYRDNQGNKFWYAHFVNEDWKTGYMTVTWVYIMNALLDV